MKTIVITGPSGSGKTYLSNRLSKLFNNSIVIKTDSYYRDNLFIRVLSIFLEDIYDRPISIKKNKLMNILRSINNKDSLIFFNDYDFKRKHSKQSKKRINYTQDNQLLILEGIFSHRLDLNYQKSINIVCVEEKEICFQRRLKRDQLERGRKKKEIKNKFNKSWHLFYQNIKSYLNGNKIIIFNPVDQNSFDKLVDNLKKINN
tara:strand:- start:353 stop:961 length:609 start_codon:yes stop_codon:yes gene_type:complete